MSISADITSALDNNDLETFKRLTNHPALLINEMYDSGLLNYMLEKYPKLPISFYKHVIDNVNTDINRLNRAGIPPLLQTTRSDIIELLLSNPTCDVNISLKNKRTVIHEVILMNNVELLVKLLSHDKIDLTQRYRYLSESVAPLNFAMENNMEMFKILLGHPKFSDINKAFGIHNPLEYAATKGNVEAIKLLLASGIDMNSRVFRDFDIDPRLNIEEHQLLQKEPRHKYYTFAEHAILRNNKKVVDIVIENLDKITKKDRLLELAIKTRNDDTINRLLDANVYINRYALEHIVENDKLVLRLIKDPRNLDLNYLLRLVLERDNIVLINSVIKVLMASPNFELVKKQIVEYLRTVTHIELLVSLIEEKLLDKESVKTIVFTNANSIFYRLLNNKKFDTVNQIIDTFPDIIPKNILDNPYAKGTVDITAATILLASGRIDIVRRLISMECLTSDPKAITQFIELGEIDILKMLIEKTDILQKLNEPSVFVKLLNLLKDEHQIIKRIISGIDRTQEIVNTVKAILDENRTDLLFAIMNIEPDIMFRNIAPRYRYSRWDDDDEDGYIIVFEMLSHINIDNTMRETLLELIRTQDMIEMLKDTNMIYRSVENSNGPLFLFILDHADDFMRFAPLLIDLIKTRNGDYNSFVMDNIDRLLVLPDIGLDEVCAKVIYARINDANSEMNIGFMNTNLYEKIIAHPNFNPNLKVQVEIDGDRRDFDIKEVSYIDYMVYNLLHAEKNLELDKEVFRMFRMLLAHPDIDVNTVSEFNETAAEYLLNNIQEYDQTIDYSSEEHFMIFPAMFNDLLRSPGFNGNLHKKIIEYAVDKAFMGLINRFLSMSELDVNSMYLLHMACFRKNEPLIRQLLTIGNIDVNKTDSDGFAPLHACIESKNTEGALILLEDPRIDISILDSKGRNYARLANKAGMRELSEVLAARGQTDDKQARVDREVAEYDARMTLLGRRKEGRIREALNNFDLILKERERPPPEGDSEGFGRNETPYSLSLCPFCLTYLEKDNPYECVYLNDHTCPVEIQNEELKRKYFGESWQTARFEICCTCGRPCSHHGHYRPVSLEGEEFSTLSPNGGLANHWRCDEHNGGGGKLEMVLRLVGMLSELKARVDREDRLVYGPELIRELAAIANRSLFDEAIRDRAVSILERKKWNVNSKIAKHARFNAPNVVEEAVPVAAVERDPITHISNVGREEKLQCMICLDDEADDVFKPHLDDNGYICSDCIKRQVCASRYGSVTCALGCVPFKQIYKEDVDALMGGNFCEGVEEANAAAGDD
jgi:ankyrin repeat protein